MIRFRNARVQYLVLLLLFWLFVNAAIRTILLVMVHRSLSETFGMPSLIAVYFRGAVNDLFPCILLMLPLLPFLLLKKRLWGGRTGRALASLVFWLYGCAFLFDAVAETLFRDEFGSLFPPDAAHAAFGSVRHLVSTAAAFIALFFLHEFQKRKRLPPRAPLSETGSQPL